MTIDPARARKLVRDSYDRLGTGYGEWVQNNDDPVRAKYLKLVLQALPEGSRVLDLGCGDGSQVTRHLASRFKVTGVDISPVLIEQAQRGIPNARFRCADLTTLDFPGSSFDGITAFYCLTHVPQPDLPKVIVSAARWLEPGGVLAGSFGISDDPGNVEADWLGVPMYFSGCDTETNRDLLEHSGLVIVQDMIETVTEFGKPVSFQWIIARKVPGQD